MADSIDDIGIVQILLRAGYSEEAPVLEQGELGWDVDTKTLRTGNDTATSAKILTDKSTGTFDFSKANSIKFPATTFAKGSTIGGVDVATLKTLRGILVSDEGIFKAVQLHSSDNSISVINGSGVNAGNIDLKLSTALQRQIQQFATILSLTTTFVGFFSTIDEVTTSVLRPKAGNIAVVGNTKSVWIFDPITQWTNTTAVYQGATPTDNGVGGFVPAATSAERNFALQGDGAWAAAPTTGAEFLFIESGEIEPTGAANILTVDTEAAAASDNLDSILTTYARPGDSVTIRIANASRVIVVKHAVGNIRIGSGVDITLSDTSKTVTLIYEDNSNTWLEQSNTVRNAAWGAIAGTLSAQTDLQAALNAKLATLGGHGASLLATITAAAARTVLGYGSASTRDVGTAVGNLVEVIAGGKLPVLDGSNLTNLPFGGIGNYQVFTANGTWTKPTSGVYSKSWLFVQVWAGGGSGGGYAQRGGGGGGAYSERWLQISDLGATQTVTVGAGGAEATGGVAGNHGADSQFDVHVYAGRGAGGDGAATYSGGSGGGIAGQGATGGYGGNPSGGTPYLGNVWYQVSSIFGGGCAGVRLSVYGGDSYWGGGGGGPGNNGSAFACKGGASFWGGGGGGGGYTPTSSGGTSIFGGNGGNGDGSTATAGAIPGGGGGANYSIHTGKAGGRGEIRLTVYAA